MPTLVPARPYLRVVSNILVGLKSIQDQLDLRQMTIVP